MEIENRRYTDEEVDEIIRRALHSGGNARETVTHDELVDIAAKSGISKEDLEEAIVAQETERELEDAKRAWVRRHRQDFYQHLMAYIIVNGALLVMNLFVWRGYIWAFWPIMGWGIGLLFHAADTFFVSDERVEKGARKLLKRRRKRMEYAHDNW